MGMPYLLKRLIMNEVAGVGRVASLAALIAAGLCLTAVLTGCASVSGPQGKESPNVVQGAKDAGNNDNKPAAMVNGVAISRAAVKGMAVRIAGGVDAAAFSKEALDRLIVAELAYERAKEAGLTISPADIDDAISDIKDRVGGEELFRVTLAEKKMDEEDLRRELGRDLLIRRIIKKEVLDRVVIDTEELQREIEKTRQELIRQGEKADIRPIRKSVEKKLKTREEKKKLAAWEADLRSRARIEIVEQH
jgi:hypothetical protein